MIITLFAVSTSRNLWFVFSGRAAGLKSRPFKTMGYPLQPKGENRNSGHGRIRAIGPG